MTSHPLICTLDDPEALDPAFAGAKAAWLARGRQAGLPILPGVVVAAAASKPAMAKAVEVMAIRGSGGARLTISQEPLPSDLSGTLAEATRPFSEPMVVRSSSILEGGGEWSGAFTSYLEILHGEVDRAVAGCWASAFTVHTLERYEAARIEPGSAPMAVLVQTALEPDFGGTARLVGEEVTVVGVEGSPAPLVQGWEPGAHARVAPNGAIRGDTAIDLMGEDLIATVAAELRRASELVGANTCEWAIAGGELFILQLMRSQESTTEAIELPSDLASTEASQIARLVRRAPGPMGEALVLPWALADPDAFLSPVEPADVDPLEAFQEATQHASALTAEVWGMPKPMAAGHAQDILRDLRGTDPGQALAALGGLHTPDREQVELTRSLLARAHIGLVEAGAVSRPELGWHIEPAKAAEILAAGKAEQLRTRIGFDRWEPFDTAVVMTHGTWAEGVAAAPGVAVGRLCFISDPHRTEHFRPRDVVVGTHPLPNLAALLWDASALITTGGGPAAHLFESAHALAIPAVCAVHLDDALGVGLAEADQRFSVAVDGNSGRVAVTPW